MDDRKPIFISYRREDEPGYVQSLYLLLEQAFGADRIFNDIEGGFQPGDDFPEKLRVAVEACDILLAVIGPGWLTAADEGGRRRLDNPADWVRVEIVSALDQQKRVIPLLVNGAGFLHSDDLPEPLKPLAHRQVQRLSNDRFARDTKVLISSLERMLDAAEAERADAALRAEAEAKRRAEEEAARRREAEARQREEAAQAEQTAHATVSPQMMDQALELANWDFIKDRDDIDALRDHLSRYPNGQTAHYASTVLEELVWAGTNRESIASLRDYLAEFPEGQNAGQARRALQEAEEHREQQLAAERKATEEKLAWAEANVGNDKQAIRTFLQQYPNGQNAVAARKRLRELSGLNRRIALVGAGAAVLGGVATWQMQPGHALWWLVDGLPDERTFTGHQGTVNSIAFAPDGKTALSGSDDNTLRLWDIATGASLRIFTGHEDDANSVTIAPDAKTALSGVGDGTLRLWDISTGDSLHSFTGHEDRVYSVAIAPDGKTALSGSSDNTLRLWRIPENLA